MGGVSVDWVISAGSTQIKSCKQHGHAPTSTKPALPVMQSHRCGGEKRETERQTETEKGTGRKKQNQRSKTDKSMTKLFCCCSICQKTD